MHGRVNMGLGGRRRMGELEFQQKRLAALRAERDEMQRAIDTLEQYVDQLCGTEEIVIVEQASEE
jgi:hypothetical protein